MRALLPSVTLVIVALAVGCVEPWPGSCEKDADCREDQFCDVEAGACFAKEEQCDPACADHQQCISQACSNRYSAVVITSPQDGRGFAPNASVTVTADLTLATGRIAKDPDSLILEVTAPGGTKSTQPMAKAGEAYEATVQLGATGAYELVAKYGGMDSAKVTVSVDTTAPVLVVTYEAAPTRPSPDGGTTWTDQDTTYANAFRRDETLKLNLTSVDSDVDGDSVEVTVQFPNSQAMTVPVASQPVDACGTTSGYCGQATVDLSKPEMNAFRAELAVTANGKDLAGNVAAAAVPSTPVKVTRWKWVHQVDSNPVRASPAVAADGTVIVGGSSSSTAGKLVALRPDGAEKWPAKQLGAIVASPAVGANGTIYVAANDTTGVGFHAFDSAGVPLRSDACRPSTSGAAAEAAIAIHMTKLSADSTPVETATTVTKTKNLLVSIRPGAETDCLSAATLANAQFPASLVASGSDIYFADLNGTLQAHTFGNLGWTAKGDWPVGAGLSKKALALVGTDVIGGGETNQGGLFAVPMAGGVAAPSWEYKTTAESWAPAVGKDNLALVGVNTSVLLSTTLGSAPASTPSVTDGVIEAPPLFAEGSRVYLVSSTGTLSMRYLANLSADAWSQSNLGTAINAAPNIDCSRNADGTKIPGAPGVLYVGSDSGKLYAFIVDSRGIATDAPWPKYQHDPRNTGNPATDLKAEEFSCP